MGGGAGAWRGEVRGVAEREDSRHLCLIGHVLAGGMERPAVEEEQIAGREFDRNTAVDQFPVFRKLGAQEEHVIQATSLERHGVGAGDDVEAAVFRVFLAEGDPEADEVWPLVRPVADVLVPERIAAVARLLGHDAVVVGERHDDLRAEHLMQAPDHDRQVHQFGEDGIAGDGVFEASNRAAPLGFEGFGSAGVVEFRFEFDRQDFLGEACLGDSADLLDDRRGNLLTQDEIPFLLEKLKLCVGEREREGGSRHGGNSLREWIVVGVRQRRRRRSTRAIIAGWGSGDEAWRT